MALETKKLMPDGTLRETSVSPDGILSVKRSHPQTAAMLKQNEMMRSTQIVSQKRDIQWALSIPEFEYYTLCKKYPDLSCGDPETEKRAWAKFIRSEESKPYRVQ